MGISDAEQLNEYRKEHGHVRVTKAQRGVGIMAYLYTFPISYLSRNTMGKCIDAERIEELEWTGSRFSISGNNSLKRLSSFETKVVTAWYPSLS